MIDRQPDSATVAVGEKVTLTVVLRPDSRVAGKLGPLRLKTPGAALIWERVREAVPLLLKAMSVYWSPARRFRSSDYSRQPSVDKGHRLPTGRSK